MASHNDKYRNPPCPPNYTMPNKPCIKKRFDVSQYIINSGILDVPDLSIFDDKFLSSSSDEEENDPVQGVGGQSPQGRAGASVDDQPQRRSPPPGPAPPEPMGRGMQQQMGAPPGMMRGGSPPGMRPPHPPRV